jgi:hypothetical protein
MRALSIGTAIGLAIGMAVVLVGCGGRSIGGLDDAGLPGDAGSADAADPPGCKATLDCYAACPLEDQPCAAACDSAVTAAGRQLLDALEECLVEAGCDGEGECARERCPAEIDACRAG